MKASREILSSNAGWRLVILMLTLSISMGDSFNVLFAKRLAEEIFASDKIDFYSGLAITMRQAMMVAGVFFAGKITNKIGHLNGFLRSVAVGIMISGIIRVFAFNYFIMITGVMVDGFSYGALYIGIRYYAYLIEDDKKRLDALAYVSGGAFVGQCMGTILGGILAGQMPYRMVFVTTVLIAIAPLVILMRTKKTFHIEAGNTRDIKDVLKNTKAIRFLVCLVIPIYMCSVFLVYVVPLAVAAQGFTTTFVSALLLANMLIAAYGSPAFTKFVSERMDSSAASFLYLLLSAGVVTLYVLFDNMPILVLCVIALGALDAWGLNVLNTGFTETKGDHEYSDNQALVAYILTTRIGGTIAPTAITLMGGIYVLPILVIAGAIGFVLTGGVEIKKGN